MDRRRPESVPDADGRRAQRAERLSFAALLFVVLALMALASIPALLLQRVSATNEELTEIVLPTYDAVNEFTVAMEQRIVATRSGWMSGTDEYDAEYRWAVEREEAALNTLRRQGAALGPDFHRDLDSLLRYVARRDSIVAAVTAAATGAPYRAAVPAFDALRDSLLQTASRLQADLRAGTRTRMAQERRWIVGQQMLALALGLIALVAVLAVGRFAIVQRQLRRDVQAALTSAELLRAEAEEGRMQLQRVTEAHNRLVRGFTHDVKNPLGAARGYLELLIDGIQGPLTDVQLRSLGRARSALDNGLGLVEELLELARAESGHLEILPSPVDLRSLLAETAEESRPLAESKGLTVDVVAGDAPVVVRTDARRVRQVLGNLMSNAIKYTRAGGIVLRLEPDQRSADARRIGIAVIDTGSGIAPEKQKLLFQEFVRLDPGASGGAGVGLTISHRIARALDGDISVESEPGRGSTFTLWLPLDV